LHVEFFDECLESFQVSDFREVDGKPNIDVDSACSHVDKTYLKMPEQNPGQDVAHHVFSVLSYFFHCRDDGACLYRWKESLLDYFGASLSRQDNTVIFTNFSFDDKQPDYKYYNDMWFPDVLFPGA